MQLEKRGDDEILCNEYARWMDTDFIDNTRVFSYLFVVVLWWTDILNS
jgi:hypothetical protein